MANKNAEKLLLVDLLVVIYAICYQLQAPLEPYVVDNLVKKAGDDGDATKSYAQLQSFFGAIQMLGSLFIGNVLDKYGIRFSFALNFVSCAASYALLASATTMTGLYLSKVPTVFMAGFLCAQTAVAQMTESGTDRVSQLGRLTMAYTIGGTIGPSLGGYLGTDAAAKLAVVGSLLAALLVSALPSKDESKLTSKDAPKDASEKASDKAKEVGSWTVKARLALASTWPLLLTKIVAGVVNSSNRSILTLALKNTFLLKEAQMGFIMSAMFFSTAVISLALGLLTSALGSEAAVVRTCLAGATVCYCAQTALFRAHMEAHAAKPLYIGLTFALAMFQFPVSTTLTALTTSRVPSHAKGTLMGIEHSLFSVAGMVGPAVGVGILGAAGMQGVNAVAASVYLVVFLGWCRKAETAREKVQGKAS